MIDYDASLNPTQGRLPPDPFLPEPAVIKSISRETPGVATLRLELRDAARQAAYRCAPGQFNMLLVPGVGEVPISVSSGPGDQPGIGHTIRFVGVVTRVIEQLGQGQTLGLRGPYGRPWPLAGARGEDVLVIAGGLGLAPVRPAITSLLAERTRYGRLMLLYGARQPADLLFNSQYGGWQQQGLELLVTVDQADQTWRGRVGVVPVLLGRLSFDPARVAVFVCGPEIMMRFTVYELLARGVPPARIFLSIERNMQCAVGMCGRCQLGPYFVCQDGPVFSYARIGHFLKQEHF
jgi:NAD(P)H-flavin reductase